MSTVDNDSALVRRAMEGDRDAFSDLAAAHWRRLLALARSIVADLEAEDVVQDALIKAWKKLGSLREPKAFSAWLTRIVANAAVAGQGEGGSSSPSTELRWLLWKHRWTFGSMSADSCADWHHGNARCSTSPRSRVTQTVRSPRPWESAALRSASIGCARGAALRSSPEEEWLMNDLNHGPTA